MSWGTQIHVVREAAEQAAKKGIDCEIIDLRTILPWDEETVIEVSFAITRKLLILHEKCS